MAFAAEMRPSTASIVLDALPARLPAVSVRGIADPSNGAGGDATTITRAEIAASVPATALFPIVLLALIHRGGGLGVGSIILLLLLNPIFIHCGNQFLLLLQQLLLFVVVFDCADWDRAWGIEIFQKKSSAGKLSFWQNVDRL